MPPRMGFEGSGSGGPGSQQADKQQPSKPYIERTAIIKDHALKEFDRLNPGDSSWAAADADIDYSAKLVWSDEEDTAAAGGRIDNKYSLLCLLY